ncbi:hypothetical protein ACPPVO_24675 [Dactylosporangium sp. McL0621]|uniref:hypothetical protein n=1 Tax=Dactylosporangium sp. McL0621 TaxID=3415678 RepID=UPI003CF9E6B7
MIATEEHWQLLFSTDHPFQRPSRTEIDKFLTGFPTDAARELFAAGNARALFGIS